MKKTNDTPKETSAKKILSKVAKITGGAALIATLGLGAAELTGCRPNKQDDLEKIENTAKPDSLANSDSTDYALFDQAVKRSDSSVVVSQQELQQSQQELQQSIDELNTEKQKLEQDIKDLANDKTRLGKKQKELDNLNQKLEDLENQYNQMLNNQN